MLIPAIGQATDLTGLDDTVSTRRDGTFDVDASLGTSRPGVFAAGDAASGPASVIEAVAQGNAVARAVDHYLHTGQMPAEKLVTLSGYEVVEQPFNLDDYADAKRPTAPHLSVAERKDCFREVESRMDEHTIQDECKRCLRCDLEWLQEMGLAFQRVPEHAVTEGGR
jgi:NADPH-dependent 2,4-dienoyl-CoA reductase/sulfur reductase-like enzyme